MFIVEETPVYIFKVGQCVCVCVCLQVYKVNGPSLTYFTAGWQSTLPISFSPEQDSDQLVFCCRIMSHCEHLYNQCLVFCRVEHQSVNYTTGDCSNDP